MHTIAYLEGVIHLYKDIQLPSNYHRMTMPKFTSHFFGYCY